MATQKAWLQGFRFGSRTGGFVGFPDSRRGTNVFASSSGYFSVNGYLAPDDGDRAIPLWSSSQPLPSLKPRGPGQPVSEY